jgi:ATP-binding cassette subfamily B protein
MIRLFIKFRHSMLWQALKNNKVLCLVVFISLAGQTITIICLPWPIKNIIDYLIQRIPTAGSGTGSIVGLSDFIIHSFYALFSNEDFKFIYSNILIFTGIIFLNSLFLYLQSTYLVELGQNVVFEIRKRLFTHLINLPQNYFVAHSSGDLTSRISNDTNEVKNILKTGIITIVRSIPTVLGILIIAFSLDWIYALTFVIVIPLIYTATYYFSNQAKKTLRQWRKMEGTLSAGAQEAIYSHKAVAALSAENDFTNELMVNSRLSVESGIKAGRFQGLLLSSVEYIISMTTALVLFIGALRILHGCLTVGQLTIFMAYSRSLFTPVRQFSTLMGQVAQSVVSYERVEEIMDINPSEIGTGDRSTSVEAPSFQGDIHFSGISFGYTEQRKILHNFDLQIHQGNKVAIVGDSGSGKTTSLNLLMRFYDPQEGQITIDGFDIRNFTLHSLRSQVAFVLQDSYIFNTTVRDNIALAMGKIDEGRIIDAAKAARAHEFIEKLENGYNTVLSEGGSKLSGGQKRRIAIARAIIRNVPIIIMDEPTAGLDANSENQVIEALDKLTENKTTIIVTHQLSTIIKADCIAVVNKGRVVETGTHEELLSNRDVYCNLWKSQIDSHR